MAKHSKGKHSQPRAVDKQEKKQIIDSEEAPKSDYKGKHGAHASNSQKLAEKSDTKEETKQSTSSESSEATSQNDGSDTVKAAEASKESMASVSEKTSEDSEVNFDKQKTGELNGVQEALQAAEEADANAEATNSQSNKTDQKGIGKHGAKDGNATGGFQPATIVIEKKQRDKKKLAKRIGITSVSVVGALAAIYLIGVFVFSGHFYPNTHISNIDISWKTPVEVQEEFEGKVNNYSFDVKGRGLNFSVTSEEAGLNIDAVAMTDTIENGQDPWKWPIEIFENRDMSTALTDALSATKLSDVVNAEVTALNETAKDPINAFIKFNDQSGTFIIEPEVQGTKLSADSVLEKIIVAAMNLDAQAIIMEEQLLPPSVLHDDERLLGALDQCNSLIAANLDLMLAGTPTCKIDAAVISPWVSVTPEFTAVIDTEAMNAYANELASQFNTIGATRNYVRADGKQVTVSGGDYGWAIDEGALAASIAEGITNGLVGTIDIPVKQSGKGFTGVGGKDWGNRYIDVDISQQHARFYGDDGNIIWESNIVSGKPSTPSPTGVYDVNLKGRHVTLTGRDSAGNITYESPVSYWMPFKGNSVGFHDADWQSAFGGNRYRSGHGSHGCINLPVSKARELYDIIQPGDVVVVHG